MALIWDDPDLRKYEIGASKGVFYPKIGSGVAWNGLTSIKEDVDNSGGSVIYMDGQKVINKLQLGQFSATLEAFTYPDEFMLYDGYILPGMSGQRRSTFGLSYCTAIGEAGYKLHLVYNCLATPAERQNNSITDTTDILTFSWKLSTTPVAFPYDRPTAHVFIDSTMVDPASLTAIENILYGGDGLDPRMPSVAELLSVFEANAIFIVVDNGDGTCTVTGPAGWVDQDLTDPTKWTLTSPSVVQLDDEITYLVRSY